MEGLFSVMLIKLAACKLTGFFFFFLMPTKAFSTPSETAKQQTSYKHKVAKLKEKCINYKVMNHTKPKTLLHCHTVFLRT